MDAEPKFKNESVPPIITKTPQVSEEPSSDDPSKSYSAPVSSHTKKVKTGDNTNIFVWIILMGISVIIFVDYRKKKKNN